MTDETSTSEKYLSTAQVAERYGVSQSAILRWRKTAEDFPTPIKLAGSSTRWRLSALEQWEAQQAEA